MFRAWQSTQEPWVGKGRWGWEESSQSWFICTADPKKVSWSQAPRYERVNDRGARAEGGAWWGSVRTVAEGQEGQKVPE